MKLQAFLLVGGLLMSVQSAQANLIANGQFASTCTSLTFCTYSAGDSTDITDWTVNSGSVDLITGYWEAPPGGGNSVDLDGNAPGGLTSSTSFATKIGAEYVVKFWLSGNPDGGPAVSTVRVSADGTTGVFSYDKSAHHNSRAAMDYILESFKFTANSTLSTLGFTSLDIGSPYGPVIGGVDAEIPEPMSLGLLGSGLVLAGFFGYRRRSRSSRPE